MPADVDYADEDVAVFGRDDPVGIDLEGPPGPWPVQELSSTTTAVTAIN